MEALHSENLNGHTPAHVAVLHNQRKVDVHFIIDVILIKLYAFPVPMIKWNFDFLFFFSF